MRALRFCFITTFYPPFHFGGDAIGAQRLARALVRRGHGVTVIHDADAYSVLTNGRAPSPAPSDDGIRVVTLRSRFPMVSTLLTQQTGHPVVNGPRIRRLLEDGRFDVIVFNNVSLVGGPGLLTYGENAVKVYLAHDHWLICPTHVLWRHGRERCEQRQCVSCQLRHGRPPQLWRQTRLLQRAAEHVDAFVAMSEFSRERHRAFGFQPNMEVIPNFVPDDVLTALDVDGLRPQERPYFLFVGRLEKIKGVGEVIPLFREYRSADFLIAGDGTYAPELRALAAGIPNVRFLGQRSPSDLATYYRHAVALIAPSVCYETFGLILIEAFRHGTPVIARKLGPFPEILKSSGGGELFETSAELLVCMERLQHDDRRRADLGRSGQLALQVNWSEDVVIRRLMDVIRCAARRRNLDHVADAIATVDDAGEWLNSKRAYDAGNTHLPLH